MIPILIYDFSTTKINPLVISPYREDSNNIGNMCLTTYIAHYYINTNHTHLTQYYIEYTYTCMFYAYSNNTRIGRLDDDDVMCGTDRVSAVCNYRLHYAILQYVLLFYIS